MLIDEDVPDEVAAMFGCAVLTGMGAVINTARLEAGQSVAVFGLGAVGRRRSWLPVLRERRT